MKLKFVLITIIFLFNVSCDLIDLITINWNNNNNNNKVIDFPAPAIVIKFFNGNESSGIPNINTKRKVETVIDNIYDHCIHTVIIIARGDDVGKKYEAKAYYKSNIIESVTGNDGTYLFEEAIRYAKNKGMNVYAWVPLLRDPAKIKENSEYATRLLDDRELPIKSKMFMCPNKQNVREYVKDICNEISQFDEVDGIIVDYVRYEGWNYCCCSVCEEEYHQKKGRSLLDDMRYFINVTEDNKTADGYIGSIDLINKKMNENIWNELRNFRENNVTELVKFLSENINKPIGAFVFPRFLYDDIGYFYEVGQNIPDMFAAGLKWAFPMLYYSDDSWALRINIYEDTIKYNLTKEVAYNFISIPFITWIGPTNSPKTYFVFGDNPDGVEPPDITPQSEYDYLVKNIGELGGGVVWYSNDGVMASAYGVEYLNRIKQAHGLTCSENSNKRKIILLKKDGDDPTVNYFRDLLSNEKYNYIEVTARELSQIDIKQSIIIAAFSSEPTEYISISDTIANSVFNGSWMIAEAFGRYILKYASIGDIDVIGWGPAVHDKYCYVKNIDESPLFNGIPNWDPPEKPDRNEQIINQIVNSHYLKTIHYNPPNGSEEKFFFWGLAITYGWSGQNTNSDYCTNWGGCTPERSVGLSSIRIVNYGNGKIFVYHNAPVVPDVHEYGKISDMFYKNFIEWGLNL